MTASTQNAVNCVPAIDKMCQILDLITDTNYPLTSAEIATELSLPRSSTHNILQSLLIKHLVFKDRDNRFHLGSYLLYWSGKYEKQQGVIDVFHELISKHPTLLENTVTLSKLDGNKVVFLSCHESPAPLGFTFRSGVRVPAPFSASGKAMLATYDDESLKHLFEYDFPAPITSRSVKNLDDFIVELQQVRKTGVSLDDGQLREGMYCLGTCIKDNQGNALAGMAVSFIKQEYEQNKIAVSKALKELSQQIAQRLGIE